MTLRNIPTRISMGLIVCMAAAPLAYAGGGYAHGPAYTPDLLPPSSNPGECWTRVKIPAQYAQESETVMVQEGYTTTEVTQPRLQSRQEQYVSKEASVRYEVRQPSFKTISENVMVRPAYDKLSVSPPQFQTVREQRQVSAPQLVWKKGNPAELQAQGYRIHSTANAGPQSGGFYSEQSYQSGASYCGSNCEIWCLVEEPGQSVSYMRKVMTEPGQVRRHTVPPKYQTITRQVVSDPGGVREIHVPPEFSTITIEDVIDPGGERIVSVPPSFGGLQKKVMISPERYEWRRVLCKPGTAPSGYSSGGHQGSSYSYGSGSSYSGSSYGTQHSDSGYSQGYSYNSSGSTGHGGHTASQPITYGDYGTHHHKRKKWRHRD